jgi:hypothetical protein
MVRNLMICLLLVIALPAFAMSQSQQAPVTTDGAPSAEAATQTEAQTVSAPTQPASVTLLPSMDFLSSVASSELYEIFKAIPAFAAMDKELAGSPLTLMVTHTVRPTAGGQAAGFLTAILSGSTLGLIPMVSKERLVVRYEVLLNGKTITSYSFEHTDTRATNLWAPDTGLAKDELEWVKSTAAEVAAKLAQDPAMLEVQKEINFYFPPASPKQPSTASDDH